MSCVLPEAPSADCVSWEVPEVTPFSETRRNELVRRPLGHENLNGGPGLRGGDAAMELRSLLSRVITGLQDSRAHMTALNCQRRGEYNCHTQGGKGAGG